MYLPMQLIDWLLVEVALLLIGRTKLSWKRSSFYQSVQESPLSLRTRVSSKQTKINFGLFHETKNKIFQFVSVFRTHIETIETNRTVS
jgi:hypothetical protein